MLIDVVVDFLLCSEVYGYVTPNMAFMVLATGLYINACAKGEECIPQTWVSTVCLVAIAIVLSRRDVLTLRL